MWKAYIGNNIYMITKKKMQYMNRTLGIEIKSVHMPVYRAV